MTGSSISYDVVVVEKSVPWWAQVAGRSARHTSIATRFAFCGSSLRLIYVLPVTGFLLPYSTIRPLTRARVSMMSDGRWDEPATLHRKRAPCAFCSILRARPDNTESSHGSTVSPPPRHNGRDPHQLPVKGTRLSSTVCARPPWPEHETLEITHGLLVGFETGLLTSSPPSSRWRGGHVGWRSHSPAVAIPSPCIGRFGLSPLRGMVISGGIFRRYVDFGRSSDYRQKAWAAVSRVQPDR